MVTINATYDGTISRVRIACSAAPALADYAKIERSLDGITWTTVRGGDAVPLVGAACSVDDYEFVSGALNTYRATYVDQATPSVVATGTLGSGNNVSVNPGMPAGVADGDILLLKAIIRNTAGSPNTPAGWTVLVDAGNFKVFQRTYTAGVTAPTVTFTGGVAGADTAARITAVRNADGSVAHTVQSNASAQNVAFPAIGSAAITPNLMIVVGWKQSTASSTSIPGWGLISNDVPSAGDDMTIFWWGLATSDDVAAGTVTIGGGSSAISEAASLRLTRKAFVSQETDDLTPTIDSVWLKNVQSPFLNRTVNVVGYSDVERPSRSGVFEIINRHDPVAVTEVRSSQRFTLTVKTETLSAAEELDSVLRPGTVVFLQRPADCPFPGGYFVVGTLRTRRGQSARSPRKYHDLPLTGVAAPDPALVGTTVTWQNVVSSFATWSALIAAEATWADVLERIGTPADVVVP